MKKEKDINKKLSNSPADTSDQLVSTADGSYRLSEWLGAMTLYYINLKKYPFSSLYHNKYERRNFFIGYLVMILGLILLFIIMAVLLNKHTV